MHAGFPQKSPQSLCLFGCLCALPADLSSCIIQGHRICDATFDLSVSRSGNSSSKQLGRPI